MTNIFVFGSNLAGRHGAGSAKEALLKHGAVTGQGRGLQGQSYALPTKDERLRTLPLDVIHVHVECFKMFAGMHPHLTFNVVKIGCGLAGYMEEQIAPMFKGSPVNVNLPKGWRRIELQVITPTPYVDPDWDGKERRRKKRK